MSWDNKQIEFLIHNWGKLSCQEIGIKIHKSKNSVIGKAHRMKLRHLRKGPVNGHYIGTYAPMPVYEGRF